MVAAGSPEALSTLGTHPGYLLAGLLTRSDGLHRRVAAALSDAGIGLDPQVVSTPAEDADHDVLIVDFSGVRSRDLRQLRGRSSTRPIVCIVREPSWKTARELLRDGATGIALLGELEETLAIAVTAASRGLIALPQSMRQQIAQPTLSTREKQILAMVVMGFSNPEISAKLFVAESTVKSHLSSAFSKLGVRSRSEAAALILDPTTGLGTGILEISGERRGAGRDIAERA
jgi:DNA-binding NarL/FixJ family response regulator